MSNHDDARRSALRTLPSVDTLAQQVAESGSASAAPMATIRSVCRVVLEERRQSLLDGAVDPEAPFDLGDAVEQALTRRLGPSLPDVINGTGILLHTGLGRSVMAPTATRSMTVAAGSFAPVEIDIRTTQRGQRVDLVRSLLTELTGAESATVVNNNAAAVLICLAAVGAGREVVVSRGELVEIGGSFRMPDVMSAGCATLREVGTTNRTRIADYEHAINAQTAALLKVHPSNFRIEGFTEAVAIDDLVALGRRHDIPVLDDIGSGALSADMIPGLASDEPTARASIEAGADLVMFSGDKLLGGPQAGIIVGAAKWIERVEQHPMMRAMRMDKVRLAGLAATLQLHRDGGDSRMTIPVQRMTHATLDTLTTRANDIIAAQSPPAGCTLAVVETEAFLGAGSMPTQAMPSIAITLTCSNPDALAATLRTGRPPVLPRIASDAVHIDLRSVLPDDDVRLSAALCAAIACVN